MTSDGYDMPLRRTAHARDRTLSKMLVMEMRWTPLKSMLDTRLAICRQPLELDLKYI